MKEIAYIQKIELLNPFLNEILTEIKKDLKNEHLRKDLAFSQKYFARKSLDKIGVADLKEGYLKALAEGNEEAGEWIASRWMLKHPEVYQFFADKLTAINPEFDQIEKIVDNEAREILQEAFKEFGARVTYIFSIFNSVAFSELIYEELKKNIDSSQGQVEEDVVDLDDLKKKYAAIIDKLTEKYEKKLLSLERRYTQDIEGYKKQIAALQRLLK